MASWVGLLIGLTLTAATPASLPTAYVVDAILAPGQRGTGLWRPSASQVDAAREALRRYLGDASAPDRNGWERADRDAVRLNYDSYILQMQGVRRSTDNRFFETEGSGSRLVRIEGFCPEIVRGLDARIKREPLLITDGGRCIFQALFDLDGDRITFFSVNGVA